MRGRQRVGVACCLALQTTGVLCGDPFEFIILMVDETMAMIAVIMKVVEVTVITVIETLMVALTYTLQQ